MRALCPLSMKVWVGTAGVSFEDTGIKTVLLADGNIMGNLCRSFAEVASVNAGLRKRPLIRGQDSMCSEG